MGALMGPGTYAAAWRAAGRATAAPHPRPYQLTRGVPIDLPAARKVIYVACVDRHARYVGSTGRGVRIRLLEHVRDRGRAVWEDVWVISLHDVVSDYGILLAEERVGRLLRPDENRRPPGR
jgi:hypothetical protein